MTDKPQAVKPPSSATGSDAPVTETDEQLLADGIDMYREVMSLPEDDELRQASKDQWTDELVGLLIARIAADGEEIAILRKEAGLLPSLTRCVENGNDIITARDATIRELRKGIRKWQEEFAGSVTFSLEQHRDITALRQQIDAARELITDALEDVEYLRKYVVDRGLSAEQDADAIIERMTAFLESTKPKEQDPAQNAGQGDGDD